jgi:hypothetical protein
MIIRICHITRRRRTTKKDIVEMVGEPHKMDQYIFALIKNHYPLHSPSKNTIEVQDMSEHLN